MCRRSAIQPWETTVRRKSSCASATLRTSEPFSPGKSSVFRPAAASPSRSHRSASVSPCARDCGVCWYARHLSGRRRPRSASLTRSRSSSAKSAPPQMAGARVHLLRNRRHPAVPHPFLHRTLIEPFHHPPAPPPRCPPGQRRAAPPAPPATVPASAAEAHNRPRCCSKRGPARSGLAQGG